MQEKQKKMILRISMYLIGYCQFWRVESRMNTKTKLGVSPINFDALCGGTDLGI